MQLILYSKPGCHLCEGLQEKLSQITTVSIELDVRDISTRDDWRMAYEYEIPVLCRVQPTPDGNSYTEVTLPRVSPRASVAQIAQLLQKYAQ
ncbi:MAG: glutaredoxin family protein [Cyanobacteria bacterium]|nr:glutaredoxin family protein [Cyanobacteriota bacterium]MDW8199734.1 glutaredoxin family protein [Cyanobacteriota bacterium SKYGB_h_bin112]